MRRRPNTVQEDTLATKEFDVVLYGATGFVGRQTVAYFGGNAPNRWHLLNNLLETLMRSLERHRLTMSEVAKNMARQSAPLCIAERHDAVLTEASRRTLQNREHRLLIYKELMRLLDAGTTQSAASRQLDVSLRTVQRWLTYGVFPERKHRVFPSIVDTYGPHLEKRYGKGCRNIASLWQEIRTQGFEGQPSTVRTWLRHRFGSPKEGIMNPHAKRSTSIGHQRIAWLMLKADPLKNGYLKALYRASPAIAAIAQILREIYSSSSGSGKQHNGLAGSKRRKSLLMHALLGTCGEIRMQSPRRCSCHGATGWWRGRYID